MQQDMIPKLGQDEHGTFLCLIKQRDEDRQVWRFSGEYWDTLLNEEALKEDHKLRLTTQFWDDARQIFCDISVPLIAETDERAQAEAEKRFYVEAHLQDMRAIVSQLIKINLPE